MNNLENIKGIVGYKVFNPDWTCRGFQYKVGKTYKYGGEIGLCKGGFHFCRKLIDCFEYYRFNPNNKVAIIVATGEIIDGEDKSVTNEITIMKEISWHEVLDMINTGKGNTGKGNTGNGNTGNWNIGNFNNGYKNTGYCNTGNGNSGYYNIGNKNSGDFNACNYSTGIFNTEEDKIKIFNKLSDWTYED